jgi:hypothetical protein
VERLQTSHRTHEVAAQLILSAVLPSDLAMRARPQRHQEEEGATTDLIEMLPTCKYISAASPKSSKASPPQCVRVPG